MGTPRLATAAAIRPFPGEAVSGDAWTLQWSDNRCRLTVIDGLGHGPEAAKASAAATQTLEAHPDLEPSAALMACHHALRQTRGAAILTAQIDPAVNRLTYAGIGNVEGRLWSPGREQRLVSFRGIVGKTMGRVRPFTLDLPDGWVLIVHTDGISTRFDLPALDGCNWQALADRILNEWARSTDDATIVLASPEP